MEIEINGYSGYTITPKGNVVSYRQTKRKFLKPQKATQSKQGYYQIRLFNKDNPKGKLYYIHRLVWETFKGEIPTGYEIDHKDSNTFNNTIENLQVLTHRENNHKHSIKRWGWSIREHRDEMIKDYELFGNYQKVAHKWKVSYNSIYRVITNTTQKIINGKYTLIRYDKNINDKFSKNV